MKIYTNVGFTCTRRSSENDGTITLFGFSGSSSCGPHQKIIKESKKKRKYYFKIIKPININSYVE